MSSQYKKYNNPQKTLSKNPHHYYQKNIWMKQSSDLKHENTLQYNNNMSYCCSFTKLLIPLMKTDIQLNSNVNQNHNLQLLCLKIK
jgi:hypothetical protein